MKGPMRSSAANMMQVARTGKMPEPDDHDLAAFGAYVRQDADREPLYAPIVQRLRFHGLLTIENYVPTATDKGLDVLQQRKEIDVHKVTYIEPGTETLAQRMEAIQDLSRVAIAAELELEVLMSPGQTQLENGYSPENGYDVHHTAARAAEARRALALEVEDLDRAGLLNRLVHETAL